MFFGETTDDNNEVLFGFGRRASGHQSWEGGTLRLLHQREQNEDFPA